MNHSALDIISLHQFSVGLQLIIAKENYTVGETIKICRSFFWGMRLFRHLYCCTPGSVQFPGASNAGRFNTQFPQAC